MKISIIHPSRGRSKIAYNTLRNWSEKAEFWNGIQYILAVDTSDSQLSNYLDIPERCSSALPLTITANNNQSAIEAINNAAKIATGDLLIVISDDFDCSEHWDTLLLDALKNKSDFLVKTQDGIQKTLITLPIMDRVYYERFGYIYHPEYHHMFCDQEMTAVGHMLGKVIELPLHFKHNHYTVGGMAYDNINAKNDATWQQGETLFNHRLKTNFGLTDEQIVKPYSEILWK